MKHYTLPTLLAVKKIILPTVSCRAAVPAKNGKNSDTGKVCIVIIYFSISKFLQLYFN